MTQRLPVVLVLLVVFVLLPLGGQVIGLYTDALWFEEVGFMPVFTTMLWTKVLLGVLGGGAAFLFLYGNIYATRLGWSREHGAAEPMTLGGEALPQLPSWPTVEPLFRRFSLPAAVILGGLLAMRLVNLWPQAIRYLNGGAFGFTEPLFQYDVGFYVFRYPFLLALYEFGFMAIGVTVLAVAGTYVLSRGVALTPRGPEVTPWARAHLLILAAILLVLKVLGYRLDAFALLFSPGGAAYGASYSDVSATLPALKGVMVLAGLAAISCLFQITRPGIRWAGGGVLLWLVGSVLGLSAYPALVQRLWVTPNEIVFERQFIERTVAATNRAYGLDNIQVRPFPAEEELSLEQLRRNDATIKNIRLWEHRPLLASYGQLQEIRPYYKFVDVDNDRYHLGGEYRQVMLSLRELSHADLPSRIWINEHLVYTHGYGAVMGPVNRVTREGLPEFFVQDIPPVSVVAPAITRPEIYYGELSHSYALVRTQLKELNYPEGDANVYTTYDGRGGVPIGSLWRRLVFAARFGEIKMLLSHDLSSESRILYHRHIRDRVQRVAPFLRLDRDPYPVVTPDGRLMWIVDAYTVSEHVPYSQPTRGIGNYIRNSVKVTVDAYHGTMGFYLIEPDEPVARSYARAFPTLFQPIDAMPADLRAHIRYPQDLLAIQAQMYTDFHMKDPQVFYNKEDRWAIPTQKMEEAREVMMDPYYTIMRLPGETQEEFILLLPFVPVQKANMIAWLAARSDPPHYGKLVLFDFPKGKLVFGPRQIEARIDQDAFISQQITLWSQAGSQVIRGSLLAIPIEESLLYVQPLYLAAERGRLPELKRVITAFGNRIAMQETLDGSLQQLFGGRVQPAEAAATAAGAPPRAGAATEIARLAAEAVDHFSRAREDFGRGNWSGFADAFRRLEETLRRLETDARR